MQPGNMLAECADVTRALVHGISHRLSSPLGALGTNIALAQQDLRALIEQWSARTDDETARSLVVKLETIQDDLGNGIRLTHRLRQLNSEMKAAWHRGSGRQTSDLRDVFSICSGPAGAALCNGATVECLFDGLPASQTRADGWLVQGPGFRLSFFLSTLLAYVSRAARDQGYHAGTVTVRASQTPDCVFVQIERKRPLALQVEEESLEEQAARAPELAAWAEILGGQEALALRVTGPDKIEFRLVK